MALIPIESKFSFYQQIRVLLRKLRKNNVSDDTLLDEKFQISSTLSIDAPDGQIETLRQESDDAPVQVTAGFNGLTGAMGALPAAYTEWLIERQYRYSDRSAKALIDLFGHRLYCLDYLAWQKHHLYALAESQAEKPLQVAILALTGLLADANSPALTMHAPLFASPVRSMVNLERWLSQRFGVAATIVPFTGGWRAVEKEEHCRLSNPNQTLATAPMIGSARLEVHSHFDVILGPMSPEISRQFTPSGKTREAVWSCIRDYVGPVVDFSVSLVISSANLAPRSLGMAALGLDLCLGHNNGSHLHQVRLPAPSPLIRMNLMLNSTQLKTDQQSHFIRWNGDIADEMLLIALKGAESLSSSYQYELRSLTHKKESELLRWHGQEVSCQIGDGSNELPQRLLHGIVTRICYSQRTPEEAECILTVEPLLSQLMLGQEMRIWQNISVPDLVHDLLNEHKISLLDLQLNGSYEKREYCVQYRESALHFIQRLLEEEGIYYYFKHSETGHTLVLTDHAGGHSPIQGESLLWHHQGEAISVASLKKLASVTTLLPAGVTLQGVNVQQSAAIEDIKKANAQEAGIDSAMFTDITPQGERSLIALQAQNTLAAYEANNRRFDAIVLAHWLSAGETFDLKEHPTDEKKFRIHTVYLEASNNFDNNSSDCRCSIEAMPADKPWHPPFEHHQPQIPGILTATVVGPDSEEIHTDEYGRIKIQFPWDKENKNDDTSSCWVRVAQSWAGGKFGAQFIPRVGSEVLVSFIQGNPDYPLVTGTVYNGQNKPPFDLPTQKTESGFVTRSATKGSVEDGHRLSFDDKKGEELLTIVAQKDLTLTVKNDVTSTIAANRNTELTKGNDLLLLKEGNMNLTLEKGNWQQEISGDVATKIKDGSYSLDVTGGGGDLKTEKALTIESTQSIELKVGDNKIAISTSGITINGTTFKLESSAGTEMKGATVKIEGSGSTEIKGAMVKVEGSGTAELKGAMVKVEGSGMTTVAGGIINIG